MIEPVLERPVLADPTTDLLVRLRPRAEREVLRSPVFLTVLLAALTVFIVMYGNILLAVLPGVFCLLNLGVLSYLWSLVRSSRRGAALLVDAYWRPTEVTVLRGSSISTDLSTPSGALRVLGLSTAHRPVLRRTGRAWIVGPDSSGDAAVRIEGSFEAYPAVRLAKAPAPGPVPKAETTDPTLLWAKNLSARAWLLASPAVGLLVGVLAFVADVDLLVLLVITLVVVLGLALGQVKNLHRWIDRKLPRLVAAGGWVAAGATLSPWTPRVDSSAETSVALRLDSGVVATVALPNALTDLLGAIVDTGGVWVAGTIAPGNTVAVGFPGYPLVAAGTVLPG
ncbi:hypothetical protein JOD54_002847 [Actinokineospora baliensis]|uniref:hypothetical protein n=1 Tax=Actinokineospora baliensis TaxID=547056 RepID=UPI0019560705|nr:hypothetical protein [Actinokineospora baliensis]MBM7772643.1 hypothetical protein [Actinokineospora baliensis]